VLRYEVDAPRATLTIDDPERRNPLSNEVIADLAAAVNRAAADPEVRVLVFTGAGDKAFSAGADLSGGLVDTPVAGHAARGALAELLRSMRRCGKPTVARVNGHALGGGLGLAAGCDIVIAADHVTLGTPEVSIGLWPMLISAVLQEVMPRRAVLEMMLMGSRLTAHEACEAGLVTRVVPSEELDATVDQAVTTLASRSPAALRMGRDAFYTVADMDFDTALQHLHAGLTAVASTEDAVEGVAAFLQKRPPEWRGR
jgi:enoyl-CoA hydratase/carnithine racemase